MYIVKRKEKQKKANTNNIKLAQLPKNHIDRLKKSVQQYKQQQMVSDLLRRAKKQFDLSRKRPRYKSDIFDDCGIRSKMAKNSVKLSITNGREEKQQQDVGRRMDGRSQQQEEDKKKTARNTICIPDDKKQNKTNRKPRKSNEFSLHPPLADVESSKQKNQKKVKIDLLTTQSIKNEAEGMLLPCTVFSLATALHDNENVMFHHGHQSSYRNDDDDDDEKGENDYYLPEQFQTCLAITEESEQNRCVRRKKRREEALKTAFRALVTSFKATDKIVRDWGELRIVLEDVLCMPLLDCEKKKDDNDDKISDKLLSSFVWSSNSKTLQNKHTRKNGSKKPPVKRRETIMKKSNWRKVHKYSQMVSKAMLDRHMMPASTKWTQVTNITFPTRLQKEEEKQLQQQLQQKDQKLETKIVPTEISTDNLLDQRLEERISEAEKIARSKSDSQSSYIDSLMLAREQEEEAAQKEEEERRKKQEEEAKSIASSLLRQLTKEEVSIVKNAMYGNGQGNEILARCDADTVQRDSMQTLRPGQWLNDEVIHYFLLMLSRRDEQMCAADKTRKRCHFFKSFFITKLFDEGNAATQGKYNYNNVKRWSKRVPGKDLFKLDKIFFPVNAGGVHWCCAVVFMAEKRIQFYDSLGGGGMTYLRGLFQYLKDEHKAKKGCPLPDEDKWELVTCTEDTPFQQNGYDCGVFTCMYSDFLSKDCPLKFSQHHITQCRQRIALSIMNGSAIE